MTRLLAACVALALLAWPAAAQDMPDPSLIHGRAIPAPELPAGTVTVRVVRESIGNNVPGQRVAVTVDGSSSTATTDDLGRAEFNGLAQGREARATVTVDGEALESQPFTVPTAGGLRVILVAGIAKAAERKAQEAAEAAAAPAARGAVVFGGNTRVLIQFQDDTMQVFYVLEVINNARTRVDIGGPLLIDLPEGAAGAASLEGSSPSATVNGSRVTIVGPFAAGTTQVQVGYQLRYTGSSHTFVQKWPAALQRVTVGVQKVGALTMKSAQFTETRDVRTDDGSVFVLGNGEGLPAGGTLTIDLAGLPARSTLPRNIALGAVGAILVVAVWLAASGTREAKMSVERLTARRAELLGELEQLESRRRAGTVAGDRYASRRQKLMADLEQVYGELDDAGVTPQGGGEGVAA